MVGKDVDLRLVAPVDDLDEGVAGDLVGEAGAAGAHDAALAVEEHEVADRYRLFEVPLLLAHPGLAGTERHRVVLQRALAALVADRAVEGWLMSSISRTPSCAFFTRGTGGLHLHVGRRRDVAGGQKAPAPRPLHVDDAHAAHPHLLHAGVPAETGDVHAAALGRGDEQLTLVGLDLTTVDGDGECLDGGPDRHGAGT